jgi:hypothetical protein
LLQDLYDLVFAKFRLLHLSFPLFKFTGKLYFSLALLPGWLPSKIWMLFNNYSRSDWLRNVS